MRENLSNPRDAEVAAMLRIVVGSSLLDILTLS